MRTRHLSTILSAIPFALACQTDLSAMDLSTLASPSRNVHSFDDTDFEMDSCEITPNRSAICRMTVTNRFRDKRIEIDRRIAIQDDFGTDYAVTAGGFGASPERPQWRQDAIADSTYSLTVVAPNLSSQATSIRAVVFTRLLVRSAQGQTLGYRDKAIFSRPSMVGSGRSSAPGGDPAASSAGSRSPDAAADRWEVVGYWDYDATDGRSVQAHGLVLRSVPGRGMGQSWSAHLELGNHASLPQRNRSLWPVELNRARRKVCANYPGYPTYSAFIDMPGESEDGEYLVSKCRGQ